MNIISEIHTIIEEISSILGKPINKDSYKIIDRGVPHKPQSLPPKMTGVYIFQYKNCFLKIGKVGENSNARFLSQHYNPDSSKSNLASSILNDNTMKSLGINKDNVGKWIKNNCRRIDIFFNGDLGIFVPELIEAALHYKYEPLYEGFKTQRHT